MGLFAIPLFTLFIIISLGTIIGAVKYRNVQLGAAGVFFVALVFGHFKCVVPRELTELGMVFFVYAVGLHAGPRFFSILRARGAAFLLAGVGCAVIGAGAAIVLAKLFGIGPALAGGLYCGATTCTPALASVMDLVGRVLPADLAIVSVGYGIAYPFSLMCAVLVIQGLPRLFRVSAKRAAEQYNAEQLAKTPPLEQCAFRISNPHCAGRTIDEFQGLHVSNAVICRVKHEGLIVPARPDTVLQMNDVVLAVGVPEELAKLEAVLGDVAAEPMYDPTGNVTSELIVVSRRAVIGRSLRELAPWERFGVVATRLRRDQVEITPSGGLTLEPGDVLRVVGAKRDINALAAVVGREDRRLDETSMIPLAAGIALGAAVGHIPIPLPGGMQTQLGVGGGAFLVGLILGYLGRLGPARLYVPNAGKNLMRELGLVIFLAGGGSAAGAKFVPVLREAGPQLFIAGAVVTVLTVATAVLLLHRVLRWNLLSCGGGLGGCMTNSAGLSASMSLADSDAQAVAFASVYPVALIAKIILAQAIFLLLRW
ncbi:MAG TPA: TrkA C-terminal domain-containing protein [Phycisphaerae bacterium]|nr:TrkA C-terminal domain-containing protein [Phycisphaerae bacterium]